MNLRNDLSPTCPLPAARGPRDDIGAAAARHQRRGAAPPHVGEGLHLHAHQGARVTLMHTSCNMQLIDHSSNTHAWINPVA